MQRANRVLAVMCALGMLAFAGAAGASEAGPDVSTDRATAGTDRSAVQFLQDLAKGGESAAAGTCYWWCSNGGSGSGPAPSPEACQAMCEISCGEPCYPI